MNAAAKPHLPGIDAFHRDRSKCVDAFADLEGAIIAILKAEKVKTGAEAFSQKLAKLAKLSASPRLSKAKLDRLLQIAEECVAIGQVRNDIVHSHLTLALIGNRHLACFVNLGHAQDIGIAARLFELTELRALANQICGLAEDLNAMVARSPTPNL